MVEKKPAARWSQRRHSVVPGRVTVIHQLPNSNALASFAASYQVINNKI